MDIHLSRATYIHESARRLSVATGGNQLRRMMCPVATTQANWDIAVTDAKQKNDNSNSKGQLDCIRK